MRVLFTPKMPLESVETRISEEDVMGAHATIVQTAKTVKHTATIIWLHVR